MKLEYLLINEEKRTIISLIISAIALIISFFKIITIGPFDFAWIAILLCGIPIIKDAVIGLITEFNIKADLLVSIALIASIIIGEIFAAGEIAFIMAIGGFLEEFTVAKSNEGIEKLVNLTPRTARLINNKKEEIINASDVVVGDLIKVLPGETIPIDGKIISGETSIDESLMTGEPIPIDKTINDEVFSGTTNQFGSFSMKAIKLGKDSSLQRMIELVNSTDAGKSKIVRQTDKWATWIVLIALTSAIATYFLTGEIIRSVTILVVFCPCALVLATPTAIMATIGNLTRCGILVKEGNALERLSKVKKIIFDKTGTLTYGKPEIIAVLPYDDKNEDFYNYDSIDNNHDFDKNYNKDCNSTYINNKSNKLINDSDLNELIQMVASLENKSEHPLGKAIVTYFKENVGTEFFNVENFQMIVGNGVKGKINGKNVLVGNIELLKNELNRIDLPMKWIESSLLKFLNKGYTIIYISIDFDFKGFIVLGDKLREDSKETIFKIEEEDLQTILLTGDNEKPAKHMANQVGIDNVYYNCLPETKMKIIDSYQNNGEKLAMIGDGINDAPSLKKSFVGIAMGGIGSDIAIDAADIVLISDDIKFIPHLIGISKKTMNTINVNIVISLFLNFVAIILAMMGLLNPVLGALVHNVGSVLVVIYSSSLLRWK